MVVYNFKTITVVPTGKDLVDVVLSKTQRKTPTIIHPSYPIARIRRFYMRKVKFAAQTYHDKLAQIIQEFPLLDDIHPFYADLMNVLYDKDHYKLALGQVNTAKHLIDNIAKDYLKLLKYGDSLYRCKQLKKAALGRMSTLMVRQNSSLAYLEQVRQHLARLPSIDPATRTLILTGYPNVGKSSFLNKVTRADVDVQPYPFTTKSLFVGHCDYQYLRWQVIDTPGILDHPLEERNTIEMQSITALAHLRAAILYLIDISEQCGYSIKAQVELFHSLKALFTGKPVIVVVNKIDLIRFENLDQANRDLIDSMADTGVTFVTMSNMTEEGVMNVKQVACDKLLEQRVEQKIAGKKNTTFLNRLHVAMPEARDNKTRPALVPDTVKQAPAGSKMEEDTKPEGPVAKSGDDDDERPFYERGFNRYERNKKYDLADDDWKFDSIPEIIDGKNIADFIDPDILARLEELEREEEERMARSAQDEDDGESSLDEDSRDKVAQIREAKSWIKLDNLDKRTLSSKSSVDTHARNVGTTEDMEEAFAARGIDASKAIERVRSASRGRKRARSASMVPEDDGDAEAAEKRAKLRSKSRSKTPGINDPKIAEHLEAVKKKQRSFRAKQAKKGETDNVILNMKPKHLLSGKRTVGKTDRR